MRKIAILLMFCVLLAGFTGCFLSFDAAKFVKGDLDSTYLGVINDDYLDIVVNTRDEILEIYEQGLQTEVEYFCEYFDIDESSLTVEIKNEMTEMYRKIYKSSKYEIGETKKDGSRYEVSITIYPIDIFQKVSDEDFDSFITVWEQRAENGEFNEMDDDEFELLWAREIIDIVNARINDIGHLEPETISVTIAEEKMDDGRFYTINESDLTKIDELIIQY